MAILGFVLFALFTILAVVSTMVGLLTFNYLLVLSALAVAAGCFRLAQLSLGLELAKD
jgi:hypothetical protein